VIPSLQVVGWSGAGKTTVLEALVANLTGRGLDVGYLKHAPHGATVDHPGTDTGRLSAAGATVVAVDGAEVTGLVLTGPQRPSFPALLDDWFPSFLDLVLVEGYKSARGPKLEVLRSGVGDGPCRTPADGVLAYVTDLPTVPAGAERLPLDQPAIVADFVHDWLRRRTARAMPEATVEACGVPLELNDFVARTLAGLTRALLRGVRGVPAHGAVSITVTTAGGAVVSVPSEHGSVALTPFVAGLVAATLRGYVAELRGGPTAAADFTITLPGRSVELR